MDPTTTEFEGGQTRELATPIAGETCSNCGAPLAADQRYCVSCGERRGKGRFSFDALAAPVSPEPVPPPKAPTRSRAASSVNLILGVATLLLAMGVGVLIGHNSAGQKLESAAGPAPKIVINSGGGGGGSGPTRTARARTGLPGQGKKAPAAPHLTTTQVKAVNNAVNNAVGGGSNLVQNPTVQLGGKCSGGAGCQNGKFTGNAFGQ